MMNAAVTSSLSDKRATICVALERCRIERVQTSRAVYEPNSGHSRGKVN
jgi:hypothetical protein